MGKTAREARRGILWALKYLIPLLCLGMLLGGVGRMAAFGAQYDSTPAEILNVPGQAQFLWSAGMTEGARNGSFFMLLSGNVPLEDVQGPSVTVSRSGKGGDAKILLVDGENNAVACEALEAEEKTITVPAGTYRMFLVGRWFTGTVAVREEET